jgi:hypothetical protein
VLYGTHEAVDSGNVTNEAFGAGVVAGSMRLLAHQFVSSVVITDSNAASPNTLPAAQYKIHAAQGAIEFLDVTTGGAYTQPFLLSYTKGAATRTAMFKGAQPQVWLRFDGINTADSNKRVIVDLYKVSIDPTKDLSLIGSDTQKFELSGMALADTSKDPDSVFGQFGRIIQAAG